jgi:hypothetical protein
MSDLCSCSTLASVEPLGAQTRPLAVRVPIALSVAQAVDPCTVTDRLGHGSHGVHRLSQLSPLRVARRTGAVAVSSARTEAVGETTNAPTTATAVPVHRMRSAGSVTRHEYQTSYRYFNRPDCTVRLTRTPASTCLVLIVQRPWPPTDHDPGGMPLRPPASRSASSDDSLV